MALLFNDAQRLLEARQRGVSFNRTLTVAHLSLYLHPGEVRALHAAHRRTDQRTGNDVLAGYQWGEYSDRFLRGFLGVESLEVLDNSSYEGATTIHDMNQPVSESLCGAFDVVIDAGSLEHIFNFPVALANMMRMTKVGGSVFITTPANNLCGHGFYQFSPELFFRVFTADNGFELRRIEMLDCRFPSIELLPVRGVYAIKDPVDAKKRVGLVSSRPAMISLEAVKTADRIPFASTPQQSDYVSLWNRSAQAHTGVMARARNAVNRLPAFLRNRILGHYSVRSYSLRNRQFYQKQ